MFFKRKSKEPADVPLGVIEQALKLGKMKVSREGNRLTLDRGGLITEVSVIYPETSEELEELVESIITVKTYLDEKTSKQFLAIQPLSKHNRAATTSSLSVDQGRVCIGSRLTTHRGVDAWRVYLPLLMLAINNAWSSFGGQVRYPPNGIEDVRVAPSAWTHLDFSMAEQVLSRSCFCNADANGLTAEFGLRGGTGTAIAGDKKTALWQLSNKQRHPGLGPGLLCILNLPQVIQDEDRLERTIMSLNQQEMIGIDLPPHFGAWCRGKAGNNIVYVTFLPNELHAVSGIAVNMSIWAEHRANIADAMLQIEGYQ